MVETNRRNKFFLTSHELTSKAQKRIGILIFVCALISIIFANTFDPYHEFWESFSSVKGYTRREFVDTFLMSIFFFAAGLELRHEFFYGHLKEKTQRRLPVVCAFGGIITPITFMVIAAGITHFVFNKSAEPILTSIPIPIATDTVFALALLSFVSKRVPRELRSLVLAIVVIDDIAGLGVLSIVQGHIPPTVIAAFLGFVVPTKIGNIRIRHILLYYLTFVVNFLVLPIFALANAGVVIKGLSIDQIITEPLFWSLIFSQCLGKLIGVYFTADIAVKKKFAALPRKCSMNHLLVAACAAGIGFTLSLYLAEAALNDRPTLIALAKIAIIIATSIAAISSLIVASTIPVRIRPRKDMNES